MSLGLIIGISLFVLFWLWMWYEVRHAIEMPEDFDDRDIRQIIDEQNQSRFNP